LPADLTARLAGALADGVDAAVATDARAHPTIALCRARALRACSAAGSLRATLAPLQPAFVPFPAEVLVNINTAQDLTASEARLAPPLTRGAKGR
jgi:molybdopterin-guanine dinucleotide biosynthesis protein A